jgi:hypothetical protein
MAPTSPRRPTVSSPVNGKLPEPAVLVTVRPRTAVGNPLAFFAAPVVTAGTPLAAEPSFDLVIVTPSTEEQ